MAGTRLTFTFNDGAVLAAIGRLRAIAASPRPLLEKIGIGLTTLVQDRFDSGTDPWGTPWKGLSPAYAAIKQGGTGILVVRGRSGGLQGSITSQVNGNALQVGSNKVYAAIHQFGGVIRAKNAKALTFRLGARLVRVQSVTMPARPYLGWGAAEEAMVRDVAEAYLAHAWGGR